MKKRAYIPFWLKLFSFYSAIIVCLFTITLAVLFPRIVDHSKAEVQNRLNDQAEHVIKNLEYRLDTMRSIYIKIKIDEHIQDAFLANGFSNRLEAQKYVSEKISTLTNIWGREIYVQIYDAVSGTFYNSNIMTTTPMQDQDWIQQINREHGMFSFKIITDYNEGGTRCLFIGDCIKRALIHEKLGYFSVYVNLNELSRQILPPNYTKGTLQILLDQDGNYVLGDWPPGLEGIRLDDQNTLSLDGKKYLICQATSDLYHFTHYILAPEQEAYMDLKVLLNVTMATVLCILVLAIFVSFMLARQITTPIEQLTEMVSRYNGDTATQSEIRDLRLNSEFSILNDHLVRMAQKISSLINDVYQQRILHQQLELQTLYKTINPHFIYNILDTIQWELRLDRKDNAIKTLYAFSHYLRNTLVLNNKQKSLKSVTLSVQDYCELQSNVAEQVSYEFHIPKELESCVLPSMVVLPLVENCYTHAFPEDYEGICKITVSAWTEQEKLVICVEDSGCGISPEDMDTIHEILKGPLDFELKDQSTRFFAVKNIQSRIRLACGPEFGLEIVSTGHGTQSVLYLPLQKGNKE